MIPSHRKMWPAAEATSPYNSLGLSTDAKLPAKHGVERSRGATNSGSLTQDIYGIYCEAGFGQSLGILIGFKI